MLIIISISGWLLLVGTIAYGFRKGSGVIIFTGGCIIMAAILAEVAATTLAPLYVLGHHPETQSSLGYWRLLLALPLMIAAFPLGVVLNRLIVWTFDPFDDLIGGLAGLVVGLLTIRYLLISLLQVSEGQPEFHALLAQTFMVRQVVNLDGWNALVNWITHLNNPPEIQVPDE